MSEWDKACCAVKKRLGYDVLTPELQKMKTEGDAMQKKLEDIRIHCEWLGRRAIEDRNVALPAIAVKDEIIKILEGEE